MRVNGLSLAGMALTVSCVVLALVAWNHMRSESRLKRDTVFKEHSLLTKRLATNIDGAVEEIKREAAQQLLSMHHEGLAFQLERWEQNNPLVESIFLGTSERGFRFSIHDPQMDDNLEQAFALPTNDLSTIAQVIRFGGATSIDWNVGFFSENLEDIRYRGIEQNPVIVWQAIETEKKSYLVCWHRLGGGEPIRGFYINKQSLSETLDRFVANLSPETVSAKLAPQASLGPNSSYQYQVELSNLEGWAIQTAFPQAAYDSSAASLFSYTLIITSATLAIVCGYLITTQSNRKYREALRKTNFVSNVSHEFKTPITSIGIYADLLANPNLEPGKQLKFATTIASQCNRLSRMVDNLLTLSALENQKPHYNNEISNLLDICHEAVSESQPILENAGLEARIQAPTANLELKTDRDSVKSVLLNLLENAAKYASSGEFVDITISQDSNSAVIWVNDQGPGIPTKYAQTIFETFTQLDNDLSRKRGGSGIGLSIARKVVRDLGGDLSLNINYKQGASFRIELPK